MEGLDRMRVTVKIKFKDNVIVAMLFELIFSLLVNGCSAL
jgi:hypothetical protein